MIAASATDSEKALGRLHADTAANALATKKQAARG